VNQATNNQVDTIAKNVESLHLHQDSQERQALLEWLSPLNFSAQQNDLSSRRQEGIGEWLLQSNEFETWAQSDGLTLLCQGMPGAGQWCHV